MCGACRYSMYDHVLSAHAPDCCRGTGPMPDVPIPAATEPPDFREPIDPGDPIVTAERDTSARLADRCLDLGRELEALRAAVRAHRAAHEAGEGETVALVRLYQLAGLT